MLRTLTPDQIDQLLYAEGIGRVGYLINNIPHITPINYVYDGEYISAYSLDGTKLRAMRINPNVCFQVDHIIDASHWQSVLAWGLFEDLQGENALKSVQLLVQRSITNIASGISLHMFAKADAKPNDLDDQNISVYRIHLFKKTGKHEQDD